MSASAPRIALSGISKEFGSCRALDNVTFEIRPGERIGVVGENGAGKSTLMNVLYGLYAPTRGRLQLNGQVATFRSPRDAIAHGIGMVHQHFTLVPTLSVFENIVLGAEPSALGLFNVAEAKRAAAATLGRLQFNVPLDAVISSLSVGAQQKVEIAKALHRGATTLILDEPTAVLTPHETDELFSTLKGLAAAGTTVILIAHKLKEILAFAERVVVLRGGALVAERPHTASIDELAQLMVGAPAVPEAEPPPVATESGVALELDHVKAPGLHDVSLSVRCGEILGIAGVDGNGQRELALVLSGLEPIERGSVRVFGSAVTGLTPRRARGLGVAHVPEDRLRHGLIGPMSVEENAVLAQRNDPTLRKGPLIDFERRHAFARSLVNEHDVRPGLLEIPAGGLSGGNQQKLVVGRELSNAPRILIAVQPTRGLDFQATAAVHERLRQAARAGCAVILISLDLAEVMTLSHRICVLFSGKVSGTFARGAVDAVTLGRHMVGAARAD